ncbi:hypothetical protein BT96DRAFT_934698 [Gymnopus androsaceus JB14]|uniref:DUF6533 domain-containing protein n=1 Tax=Gymnopus androsaceus JB14 TaxID=1447944 RepID=A0A6A4I5B8_9AGAR|nr:hypothetical protein BT96DRAFT_934698 [Gymnopus androsaceus JB14]
MASDLWLVHAGASSSWGSGALEALSGTFIHWSHDTRFANDCPNLASTELVDSAYISQLEGYSSLAASCKLQPQLVKYIFLIQVSPLVLVIYDVLATFPTETILVWTKPWSMVSLLYFANKYIMLFYSIANLMGLFPGKWASASWCHNFGPVAIASSLTSSILTQCMFALRVYAIYNRNLIILIVLSVIILLSFSLSVVVNLVLSSFTLTDNPTNLAMPFLVLAFDGIVFGLTLAKTFHQVQSMHALKQRSITEVVLRDASAGLSIYSLQSEDQSGTTLALTSIITPIFNLLPVILSSRLYLSLKSFGESTNETDPSDSSNLGSLQFASNRILGNIGAPLTTISEEEAQFEAVIADRIGQTHETSNHAGIGNIIVPVYLDCVVRYIRIQLSLLPAAM